MRNLLAILLTVLVLMPTWGRQRSIAESEAIARNTFTKGAVAKSRSLMGSSNIQKFKLVPSSNLLQRDDITPNKEAFYVCVPEVADNSNQGYVLVSGDDRMPAVLAFSEDGTFDPDNIPENMMGMLQNFAEALKQIESGQANAKQLFATESTTEKTVEPLLGGIKYNQGNPYNLQCPLRPSTGTRPATGCVATAYAQVMRYFKWPQGYCTGEKSYTSTKSNDTIDVYYNFNTTKFDWENMMETYKTKTGDAYTGTTELDTTEVFTFSRFVYKSGNYLIVDSVYDINTKSFSGQIQLILADSTGKMLQPVGTPNFYTAAKKGSYYTAPSFAFTFPANYPKGKYRLYIASLRNKEEKWVYMKNSPVWKNRNIDSCRQECYVEVTKESYTYTMMGNTFTCEYTDVNAAAVAQLMAACGAAVGMSYGSSSGTYTSLIPTRAAMYFYYDQDAAYVGRSWGSELCWHQMLQKEMNENRPVIYDGNGESGGAGHCFVLDGYKYIDNLPYYHVNWGWGGSSNGYFLITLLKPSEAGTGGSTTNYANSNCMIVNFQPENGVNEYTLGCKSMTELDSCYITPGESFELELATLQNLAPRTFAGKVYVCLQKADGKNIILGQAFSTTGLKKGYYLTAKPTVKCTIPDTLAYGDYTLTTCGIPNDGGKCNVFNAHAQILHVVDEDPANKIGGKLRYIYDEATLTAKVHRYSSDVAANTRQYSGDLEIPDSTTYEGNTYEVTGIEDSTFCFCSGLTSITMSNHIKTIGKHAFNGCTALTSIVIPDSVTTIETYAFNNCSALASVKMPNSITMIGSYAFSGTALTKMVVPDSVTAIALRAFNACSSLKEVTLPAKLKTLTAYAFIDCTALTSIYAYMPTPLTVPTNVFKNVDKTVCTLYVPEESISLYQAKTTWKDFTIKAIPTNGSGDINGDKKIDVADLTALVSLILQNYSTQDDTFKAADLNGDGVINIADLTLIINKIMDGEETSNTFEN